MRTPVGASGGVLGAAGGGLDDGGGSDAGGGGAGGGLADGGSAGGGGAAGGGSGAESSDGSSGGSSGGSAGGLAGGGGDAGGGSAAGGGDAGGFDGGSPAGGGFAGGCDGGGVVGGGGSDSSADPPGGGAGSDGLGATTDASLVGSSGGRGRSPQLAARNATTRRVPQRLESASRIACRNGKDCAAGRICSTPRAFAPIRRVFGSRARCRFCCEGHPDHTRVSAITVFALAACGGTIGPRHMVDGWSQDNRSHDGYRRSARAGVRGDWEARVGGNGNPVPRLAERRHTGGPDRAAIMTRLDGVDDRVDAFAGTSPSMHTSPGPARG